MLTRFFAVPALNTGQAEAEVNEFCRSQRVVSVERHFVADGANSFWAICVVVAPGPGPLPDAFKSPERRPSGRGDSGARVDYKQVLSEAEFKVFAVLRVWRKATAERDGLPVYAVFTNEQLAEVARMRPDSLSSLGSIDGIGPARVERYGVDVLAQVAATSGP